MPGFVHGQGGNVSDLDPSEVILKDLRLNPNRREIGNGVETHFRLNGDAGQCNAFGDETRNGRVNLDLLLHLAGRFEALDFTRWNSPLF